MTIVIHLHAGNFSLLTASDTQETYAGEERLTLEKSSDTGERIHWAP